MAVAKRKSSSRGSVPGTRTGGSHRIPLCSVHKTPTVRADDGKWYCPTCADEHLRVYLKKPGRSSGGVELPAGVEDPRHKAASFTDLAPNRAERRRIGKVMGRAQRSR